MGPVPIVKISESTYLKLSDLLYRLFNHTISSLGNNRVFVTFLFQRADNPIQLLALTRRP